MKIKLAQLMTMLAVLFSAIGLLAQEESAPNAAQGAALAAMLGGILLVCLIFAAVFYIYGALALQTIAKKTNTENGWMAWIPIVNLVLLVNIAKKPVWWFILLLIPIVNIVMGVIVTMAVAEARNKPSWWGILVIVPGVGLIVPGYLAWSE